MFAICYDGKHTRNEDESNKLMEVRYYIAFKLNSSINGKKLYKINAQFRIY